MTKPAVILYCHCKNSEVVPKNVKKQVLSALTEAKVAFETVEDLCRMCARKEEVLKSWASAEHIKIAACFPRAVRWLFHAGGAPLPQEGTEIFNMRTENAEKIITSLTDSGTSSGSRKDVTVLEKDGWIPWFPVIDYGRCKNCKQCLSFCLFGVYALDAEEKVKVANPANCKTNCPACARVCPHQAIIFPKYTEGPINGDEVKEVTGEGEEGKLELAELMKGDVYEKIRWRSTASGKGKSESSDLTKLRQQLDIPAEVLASLPRSQIARFKKAAENKGDNE
ncbi:MAG: 4Fe-4S dicluster domain-containing protein [Planctomycetota bacterium]|jgi:NAD-dependent dihydropyrimidine dehydrogenase PreA subunit